MIDLAAIACITRDTVRELTDIAGLIEKNIASYDRIAERFRRKRVVNRLNNILRRLTDFRVMNIVTLLEIAERLHRAGENSVAVSRDVERHLEENGDRRFRHDYSLQEFFNALLETRDLIHDYKRDIVGVDYRLYEELEEAVLKRIDFVEMLRENDKLSLARLESAYASYSELISSITLLKENVQSAAKKEAGVRSVTRTKTSKKIHD